MKAQDRSDNGEHDSGGDDSTGTTGDGTEQTPQAQRLQTVGALAAGIAHEINTPTQYVADNTRFLKDAFDGMLEVCRCLESRYRCTPSEDELRKMDMEIRELASELDLEFLVEEVPLAIQQSLEGIERITRIVGAMRDFSHPGLDELMLVDINKCIESTITVARGEWKYVATVERELERPLPPVPCRAGELNQVLLNLLVNAAHAIEAGRQRGDERTGVITLRTERAGEAVRISVSDTGTGIPEAIRPRIFDRFFTTKKQGRGTGQGLAISRQVIEKIGGALWFETEEGIGSTFVVELPIEPGKPVLEGAE